MLSYGMIFLYEGDVMKKKRFSFWKFLLWLLIILLLAIGGFAYYVYRRINNIGEYQDKFAYDYSAEIAANPDDRFEDHIFYDKENYIFTYDVPAYYLYKVITLDSMREFLSLPEDFTIDDIGIDPDLDHKKVNIYLSVKYKNYFNTCLKIVSDLSLSQDQTKAELRYDDFFVVSDKVTESLREYVVKEKGELMYTHRFPVLVPYYRMPDYRPDYISNLSFENDTIHAEYDLGGAMKEYLDTTERHEDSFEVAMEKVWLEVRMNGIAHDVN